LCLICVLIALSLNKVHITIIGELQNEFKLLNILMTGYG